MLLTYQEDLSEDCTYQEDFAYQEDNFLKSIIYTSEIIYTVYNLTITLVRGP